VVTSEEQEHLQGDESPYLVSKSTLMGQGVAVQEMQVETIRGGDPALTRHLGPLPDRFSGGAEIGRWEVHTYDLSDGDLRQLARFAASSAGG
jgi:hypothetical protein